ncbi:MAG: cellulase family glycosylhydrolase [Chloroflexi bacterium]|nr:cellulase family glycosylhydrolase [Chloroflexota bacterium]
MKRFSTLLFPVILLLTACTLPAAVDPEAPISTPTAQPSPTPRPKSLAAFAFENYWSEHGGQRVLGNVLTDDFPDGDKTVQYFERAVLEYDPGQSKIDMLPLGKLLTAGRENEMPFRPVPYQAETPDFRYIQATGHTISFGFKKFWEDNGGYSSFGFPISEEFAEVSATDGKIRTVQYFEKARFEHHHDLKGTPPEIGLGLLGVEYAGTRQLWVGWFKKPIPLPPAPLKAATLPFPLKGPHIGYGMNVFLSRQDTNRVLGLVKGAGFDWARIPLEWRNVEPTQGQFDWADSDNMIDAMYRNRVKPVLTVLRSPPWATSTGDAGFPDDPADYRDFIYTLAARYKGKVAAYEIWNEENTAGETKGRMDVEKYVQILKAGYEGVKAADPQAVVVFGALTPTGVMDPKVAIDDVAYLEATYRVQGGIVKNYFDVLGAHPGSNNNSPDQIWPDNPGTGGWSDHRSFYFRRIEDIRAVMEKYGDGDKQMWLTEFGWTTKNPDPNFKYGDDITPELQAQYLVRAFEKGKKDYPWMGVMLLWNLNYSTVVQPTDEKVAWSIINQDFSPRPAYSALKAMPKRP